MRQKSIPEAHLKNLPDEMGDLGEREGDSSLGGCGSNRPEIVRELELN